MLDPPTRQPSQLGMGVRVGTMEITLHDRTSPQHSSGGARDPSGLPLVEGPVGDQSGLQSPRALDVTEAMQPMGEEHVEDSDGASLISLHAAADRRQVCAPGWDTFLVSLSEGLSTALSRGVTRSCPPPVQAVPQDSPADQLGSFCMEVKRALTPILSRPATRETTTKARRPRIRRNLDITPRCSVRLARGTGRGSAATKQQQVIIRKLCLANEGEIIGDATLQSYVELFTSPLSDAHIAAVLALFCWEPSILPLQELPTTADVEA